MTSGTESCTSTSSGYISSSAASGYTSSGCTSSSGYSDWRDRTLTITLTTLNNFYFKFIYTQEVIGPYLYL